MALKRIFKLLGPGFVTGAADNDPSGIATYAQTGAMLGYKLLWMSPFTYPLMTVVQEMCARIGLVTGKGLAAVIKQYYPRWLLYLAISLVVIANTINIGTDLGAMAEAAQMLVHGHYFVWLALFTAITLTSQVFISYRHYARYLKWLTAALFAYIVTAFVAKVDWMNALRHTIVPQIQFNQQYLMAIVAVLGTTITPYLFFWQASEEVEKEVEDGHLVEMGRQKPHVTGRQIMNLRVDTLAGMFFCNLVFYFIILTTATTLGLHGVHDVASATQAALALRPVAGEFAFLLFALGLIGTGLLAVPTLAGSAAYAVSETFGWNEGLYKRFSQAKGFYLVIIVSVLVGILINFLPISAFKLLYYTAVLNGLCSPPLQIIILIVANNRRIMGSNTNSRFLNIVGWFVVTLMSACAIALVVLNRAGS
jgi:NRAMP (natural resistance-associated macrophage protein)-like metal ion transporter